MFGLGAIELALIAAVVLVVVGGRRLPTLGRELGRAIGGLRRGIAKKESLLGDSEKAAAEDVEPVERDPRSGPPTP